MWKIVTVVSLIAVLTAAVVIGLWWAATSGLDGKDLVSARLDALRVGLSVGVGGGGVLALYLAWRRQRATEADLNNREQALAHQLVVFTDTKVHQERVAAATERDAEVRRITDLYTKAVEQLGSEKAPVRLGGLYALERLAQDNPSQRQTIVNVLCAYLRMPYHAPGDLPGDEELAERAEDQVDDVYWQRVQEMEVRITAQRILVTHLRAGRGAGTPVSTFWADIDLDLTSATLVDLDFDLCRLRTGRFTFARFVGRANFRETQFDGATSFRSARFKADAMFLGAWFDGDTDFGKTRFAAKAVFNNVHFGFGSFENAVFAKEASFREARFGEPVLFYETRFDELAEFRGARFIGTAGFGRVTFAGSAEFRSAKFSWTADFASARFADTASFRDILIQGRAAFSEVIFSGDMWFSDALFAWETTFTKAEFAGTVGFERTKFTESVSFDHCMFAGEARFEEVDFVMDPELIGATFSAAVPTELAPFT